MDNLVVAVLVAVAAVHFLYKTYVDSTKDVNDLYLAEQSLIDETRLAQESAIYKSNKLDYGNGLRVGLDIRYDTYKVRNGNFCDVWELMMKHAHNNGEKALVVHDETIKITHLNFLIHRYVDRLHDKRIKTLGMPIEAFLRSPANVALFLACLVDNVLVHLYDDVANINIDEVDGLVDSPDKCFSLDVDGPRQPLDAFANEYNFEKDRGKRLRITRKLNSRVISTVDFLPINFMSSVASTIKHLPPNKTFSGNDRLVLVQSTDISNQDITQILTKLFTGFVCGCDMFITSDSSWNKISSYEPTVVLISQKAFANVYSLAAAKSKLNLFSKLRFRQALSFLARGKFSRLQHTPLKLVYIHKSIEEKRLFNTVELNQLRVLLASRIIVESCQNNLTGPVLLTDFYDYRLLPQSLESQIVSYGCVCQSLEVKLVNLDANSVGDIQIRGYNIGKGTEYFIGRGFAEAKQNSDGFMTLSVKGKWGKDGCLYVYS